MTRCTTAPLGMMPFGYHIVDFSERYVNAGAEASITFIGPSATRFDFLGEIFGYWLGATDPVTGECCVCLNKEPCPYPYILNAHDDGHGNYTCDNSIATDCIWPDTFTIQRESETSVAMRLDCDNRPPLPECNKPLYYGSIDAYGNACECYCEITINYRHRYHAGWPKLFNACEKYNLWVAPSIPQGTFIEVRMDGFASARLLESDTLTRFPSTQFPEHLDPQEPCEPTYTTPTPSKTFVWCTTPTTEEMKVGKKSEPSRIIQTVNLEVLWTNVPMYDKLKIDSLVGCVNDTIFLGYPPESVLFMSCDPVIRGTWGCNELYDLTLKFIISTVPINCPSIEDNIADGHFNEEDLLRVGVFNNQLGLWNRVWFDHAVNMYYTTVTGDPPVTTTHKHCCTNWVPVKYARAACCEEDGGSELTNMKLYPLACLDDLFTINECRQCYDDCPGSWPDCAFE